MGPVPGVPWKDTDADPEGYGFRKLSPVLSQMQNDLPDLHAGL